VCQSPGLRGFVAVIVAELLLIALESLSAAFLFKAVTSQPERVVGRLLSFLPDGEKGERENVR
jgi:hypothetical protein